MIKNLRKNKSIGTLPIIIIATFMLTSLTACTKTTYAPSAYTYTVPGDSEEDKASPSLSEKPSVSAEQSDKVQNDSNSKSPSSSTEEKKDYYGEWSVAKVLAYGSVGTYSKEDAEKLMGKTLNFSADEAKIFTDKPSDTATIIKKPSYKKDTISGSDFLANFRMSFDKLGISADLVTEIAISDPDGGVYMLLIKDSDTMILAVGGTYFELVRAK